MVDLPNDNWIRSDKQPNWSVCLDPADRFYGWKMYECNGNWVSGQKLTAEECEFAEECEYALNCGPLREEWPKFQRLLDDLRLLEAVENTTVSAT